MAKRPKVPTALHAELTEYSSLLRALRTGDTLDLSSHLAEPPPFASQISVPDDASLIDDAETTHDPPLTESASHELTEASSSVRSGLSSLSGGQRQRKAKQRDTWTRWPLLAGDVHVPEWGLDDEVKHIAEQVLAISEHSEPIVNSKDVIEENLSHDHPVDIAASLVSDEEEHSALSSLGLQALTADSAAFLSRVLALLAAHVPTAEKSMQNRTRPISWETVLDVACANDAITTKTAKAVRERMSRLYTPSQPDIVHRVDHLRQMKETLNQRLSKHDDSLLTTFDQYRQPEKPQRRKRGPYKKPQASNEAGPSTKRQRSEDGR